MREFWLGRLNTHAFKHDLIEYGAGISMAMVAVLVFIVLTYTKKWKWLWKEWITTVDAKKIGVMYVIVAAIMLFKGLIDALMMRAQQAVAAGDNFGYLHAEHFQQIFSAHGATMIFFVGMGVVFALFNLVVPLQIGARDVAFPFLNSISFWLFAMGALFLNLSLVMGHFGGAGWLSYPPLSGVKYSPGVGIDYWNWTVQIAGVGSLFSGINFFVTILRMRCPGMTLHEDAYFCLELFGCCSFDHLRLPHLDHDAWSSDFGPCDGHALFHLRFWGQSDALHQFDLGMGPS